MACGCRDEIIPHLLTSACKGSLPDSKGDDTHD